MKWQQFFESTFPVEPPSRKMKREKGHKIVTFYHHVEAPFCNRSAAKFGDFVELTEVVTLAEFYFKIFNGFFRPRGGKKHVIEKNLTHFHSQFFSLTFAHSQSHLQV